MQVGYFLRISSFYISNLLSNVAFVSPYFNFCENFPQIIISYCMLSAGCQPDIPPTPQTQHVQKHLLPLSTQFPIPWAAVL